MLVPKLRRFGIQRCFKPQKYLYPPYSFISRPSLKLSLYQKRLPPLSLSSHFSLFCLHLHCLLLATTVFCPLISQILECHSFLCRFRYSEEVLQKISNFDAAPYSAFFEVCLGILFSMVLNDLLWIQFSFFFFLNGFFVDSVYFFIFFKWVFCNLK